MIPKLLVTSLSFLLGVGLIAPTQSFLKSAIVSSHPLTNSEIALPSTLAAQILADLRQRLGLTDLAMASAKIIRVVTQPDAWQVTVQAQGQTWVYRADQTGTIDFSPVESIPPSMTARVASHLGIPVVDLRIKAAQLVTPARECPPNANCMAGDAWGWRILTLNSPHLLSMDAQGNRWKNEWQEHHTSAGLPLPLKTAVMRDVINRSDGIPKNLRVLSIRPLTWKFCGGPSGDRPSNPLLMGICQNITYSGWQMRVQSGGVRYVYYVQRSDTERSISPDGLQSIPQSALLRIKQEAAQRGNVSANEIAIQQVWAQYFDRCLDVASSEPGNPDCRNEIRAGWGVMVGAIHTAPGQPTSWVYHVDLLGTQAQFIRATNWTAPPTAPLPRR